MKISSRVVSRRAFFVLALIAASWVNPETRAAEIVGYPNGSTNSSNYNLATISGRLLYLDPGSGTATQAGQISGSGDVHKLGAGTLNLTALSSGIVSIREISASSVSVSSERAEAHGFRQVANMAAVRALIRKFIA
jgi:hypothetical protein